MTLTFTTHPVSQVCLSGARHQPSHWDPLVAGLARNVRVPLEAVGAGGVFAVPGFDEEVEVVVRLMLTQGPGQLNRATARLRLKQWLKDHHYSPSEPGSASDLSTDVRLNLILEVQAANARGAKQYAQDTTRTAVSMYPCWEFARLEQRKEPRDWPEVWEENGGSFYPGSGSYPGGKMVARKDSSIWVAINYFGLPHRLFHFNSGMGQRNIDRDWCVANRLVRPDEFTLAKEAA